MSKEHSVDQHNNEIEKSSTPDRAHYESGADEALKVLAVSHPEGPITPEEEKAILRKIDLWLMPIMCMTYGLQYVDKAALSLGALFTLVQDLNLFQVVGLTPAGKPILDTGRYSNAAMIFYCGYLLGAYPLAALAQKMPIAKACALYVLLWGICAICTPVCTSYTGILVQRFFLGFLESGVSPAFLMMTSMWYKKTEVAFRTGAWYSCTGLSVVISTPISIGLLKIVTNVSGWRILYYFWGGITILWAVVVWLLLPDSPITAKFFNDRQRYVAIERLRVNQAGVENKTIKPSQILDAFTDIKVWLLIFMSFLLSAPNGAVSTFTTIVLGTVTGDKFRTAVLIIPSGVVSFVAILLSGFVASSVPNARTFMILFFCIPALIGSALLWKIGLDNTTGMLAGLYLQPVFAAAYVQVLGFAVSNVAGYTKKAVVSACVFIAYCCGNIAGPLFFKADESPLYPSGFEATVACLALGFVFSVAYRFLLARENNKRDAAGPPPEHDGAFDDLTDNQNPRFRYSL